MDLTLPSCLWPLRIFPSLLGSRLTIFYRDASSAILQLVNQWLDFTSSRSQAFRYGRKNTNPTLARVELNDFRNSRCAGYLLDHSGDELVLIPKCKVPIVLANISCPTAVMQNLRRMTTIMIMTRLASREREQHRGQVAWTYMLPARPPRLSWKTLRVDIPLRSSRAISRAREAYITYRISNFSATAAAAAIVDIQYTVHSTHPIEVYKWHTGSMFNEGPQTKGKT